VRSKRKATKSPYSNGGNAAVQPMTKNLNRINCEAIAAETAGAAGGAGTTQSRRLLPVPFNVTIPPGQRDTSLAHKLESEWPAILRWMIEGSLGWRRNGLKVPTVVRSATDDYFDDQDTVGLLARNAMPLTPLPYFFLSRLKPRSTRSLENSLSSTGARRLCWWPAFKRLPRMALTVGRGSRSFIF
jgi:hypothetical protein